MKIAVRPAAAASRSAGERGSHRLVEVLGRLVEDEDRAIGEDRAGELEPLALTTRQPRAGLAHEGVQPVGQGVDPVEQVSPPERVADLVVGGAGSREADVLGDGRVEQVRVLRAQARRRRARRRRRGGGCRPRRTA